MRIHQFYKGSAVTEAAADSILFTRSLITGWGIQSQIFTLGPSPAGTVRSLDRLAAQAQDLLLIHQTDGDAGLLELKNIPCRKALVCHDGCSPSAELRQIVEAAVAVSPFAARRLSERGFPNAAVIPLLKDFAALRSAPHERVHYHDETAVFRLLSAGGILSDQGLDDVVEFIAAARSIDGIPIELVLIGDRDDDPAYANELEARIRRLGVERHVRIEGAVGEAELFGHYRSAAASISLSEREGLDVRLLEAMALDRPVVAYRSPGAAETLAGTGITIDGKEARAILEPLERLHRDRAFRRDTIRAQRRRLLHFSRERVADQLASWLGGLGIAVGEAASGDSGASRIYYVIEGPFESSYSLASVNRNLAASLDAREGCAGSIEPSEGDAGYSVDIAAAARLPQATRDLVRPAPLSAERIVTIRNMFPCRPNGMLGDLRLVHLAWEESAIPPELARLMNLHLDGVLVPSEYCKRAVRDSGVRLPIAVVGHGIDHEGVRPPPPTDRTSRSQPSPEAPFVFLNISAGVDRKGVEELVIAYSLAFSRRDPVLLVIKTYHNEQNLVDQWVARVRDGMPEAPVIQVVFEELQPQEMEMLYAQADAVVLPARGEGFNLPAAEAMARGVPVIVTRHSGHLDFCNDANSFLVDCRYEMSTSYLRVPDSVWVRPSLQHLAAALKTIYREARVRGSATHTRALRAQQDVANMRWSAVAERVDRFVRSLEARPVVTKRLRLAWVSADNTRDAIAQGSQHLVEHFDPTTFDIAIFAADQPPIGPDPPEVRRTRRSGDRDLAALGNELLSGGFDAVFFHHDFGLCDSGAFAALLRRLREAEIDAYVMLHAPIGTPGSEEDAAGLRLLAAALAGCRRVFVHRVDDMNRLKSLASADNLVLVPHGVIDRPPLPAAAVRVRIGLARYDPVIGALASAATDLRPLLHGFLLLMRRHPAAFLLIVDGGLREAERQRLGADIDELGLAAQSRLIEQCRDGDDAIAALGACDIVICPDQSAGEAVRFALSSGRPAAMPPAAGLAELSDLVHRLPGSGAVEIAEGLASLLGNGAARDKLALRQRRWIERHGWGVQAARIGNILLGCCEERLGAELRPPAAVAPQPAAARTPPPDGGLRSEPLDAAEALRRRRPPSAGMGAAEPRAEAADAASKRRRRPAFLHGRAGKRAVRRADRARDLRDWTLAARYYRLALKHQPHRAAIWVQYGHALKESGNFAAAEDAYRRAIALAPAVADSHLQLGHLLKLRGRAGAAVSAYLEALRVDPHFAPALSELAALGWSAAWVERALLRSGATVR